MCFNKTIAILIINTLLSLAWKNGYSSTSTFHGFGYDDLSITGLNGAGTFYFPIEPDINLDSSVVELKIVFSQVLDRQNSFINLIIADKPYVTMKLPENDDTIRVSFSIGINQVVSGYLKLKITTNIRITDNRCNDLTTDALWVKVLSSSTLILPKDPFYQGKKKEYINQSLIKKKALIYPDSTGINDIFTSASIHSFFYRLTGLSLPVYTFNSHPDSLDNYIIVGSKPKLPNHILERISNLQLKAGQGLIYLDREILDSSSFPHQKMERLIITGYDDDGLLKAVSAFLSKDIILSTFTKYVIISEAKFPAQFYKPLLSSKLTFSNLGAIPEVLEGIGTLSNTYAFRKSDFGVATQELELAIQAKYTPIGAQDRGFFNLFLNGHFLKSIRLDEKGRIEFKLEIDYHKLQKDNILKVEFVFYPSGDDCKYSFLKFNCQIDVENSYLKVLDEYLTQRPNFFWFPEIFYDKPVTILVSKGLSHDLILPLSEIYTNLNKQLINKFDIYPPVFYSSSLGDIAIQDLTKTNHVIALLDSRDPVARRFNQIPINYTWKFKNIRNAYANPMFQLLYSDQVAIAQIFHEKSNNIVLAILVEGKNMSNTLTSIIKSFQKQSMPVKGNVIIGNEEDIYFFDVYEKHMDADEVSNRNSFLTFWNEYSNYFLVLMLVLTLLFFLFLRQRSQKSKAQF